MNRWVILKKVCVDSGKEKINNKGYEGTENCLYMYAVQSSPGHR